MRYLIFHELKRVFQLKHSFMLLLFFGLALYVAYFGAMKYKDFLEEKERFLYFENLKVNQYITYEQYGAYGFRVLLQPSSLIVFSHSCFKFLESIVDTKEMVRMSSAHNGRKIFSDNRIAADFSTVFFVLGSLLMLYFGLNTFPGIAALRFHNTKSYILNTLGIRLFILTGYFTMVILDAFFFVKVLGIYFSKEETIIFFKYSLFILAFLTLFYFLGTITAVLLRFKKVLSQGGYLIWFLVIFVIPQLYNMNLERGARQIKSNESVNIKKFDKGIDFEIKVEAYFRRLQEKKVKDIRKIARKFIDAYIKKIIPQNRAIEARLNREVKRLIQHHENNSVIAPSSFYCFLSKECSSMGFYGYQDFLNYILRLKDGFYRYYFDKRYNQIDQTIESFVKKNENIFLSKSFLPANYWKGVSIIFLYLLLLMAGTMKGLWRISNPYRENPQIKLDLNQLDLGKSYFYFSRNVQSDQINGMLYYLKSQKAIIIEKPDSSFYDPGITLKTWILFEAYQKQINSENLLEYMEVLGISHQQLNQRIKNLDNEVLYTAYLGIQLAQNTIVYVCKDFLDRVSREFEHTFKEAIDKLIPQAIIIYFSSQMFDITAKEKHNLNPPHFLHETGECRFVAVDFNDITLR